MDNTPGGPQVAKFESVEELITVGVLEEVDENQLLLMIGGGEKLVLVGIDSVWEVEHVVSETARDFEQVAVTKVSVIVSVSVVVDVSVCVSVVENVKMIEEI